MRSAALFALFGCLAALVSSLGKEQPLEDTLRGSLTWGFWFGFLGWGIGRVARLIAGEVVQNPSSSGTSGSGAMNPSDKPEERSWVRPDRRPNGGTTPPPGAASSPEPAASLPESEAQNADPQEADPSRVEHA